MPWLILWQIIPGQIDWLKYRLGSLLEDVKIQEFQDFDGRWES